MGEISGSFSSQALAELLPQVGTAVPTKRRASYPLAPKREAEAGHVHEGTWVDGCPVAMGTLEAELLTHFGGLRKTPHKRYHFDLTLFCLC